MNKYICIYIYICRCSLFAFSTSTWGEIAEERSRRCEVSAPLLHPLEEFMEPLDQPLAIRMIDLGRPQNAASPNSVACSWLLDYPKILTSNLFRECKWRVRQPQNTPQIWHYGARGAFSHKGVGVFNTREELRSPSPACLNRRKKAKKAQCQVLGLGSGVVAFLSTLQGCRHLKPCCDTVDFFRRVTQPR